MAPAVTVLCGRVVYAGLQGHEYLILLGGVYVLDANPSGIVFMERFTIFCSERERWVFAKL